VPTDHRAVRTALHTMLAMVAAGASSWLVARAVLALSREPMGPWLLARAGGLTSYLLLVALVCTGLVLAHPWGNRITRPTAATRLRIHAALASGALAFTVLHVVALALDEHAGVGWQGVLLPMASTYRPVPVTLGVTGLYAGLVAGLTASMAGRLAARVWWPVHKAATVSLVLVWAHSVLAGSDTPALMTVYLGTGGGVLALAISRYTARTTADQLAGLSRTAQPTTSDLHLVDEQRNGRP
jgi:hypothetical protein